MTFAFVSVYMRSAAARSALRVLGGVRAVTAYIRCVRNQRMLKFDEQFPEAIDLLARALRAGHALTTGLLMVAEELPEPIGPEFKTLYDQQNFGLPLPQALRNFAERIPSLDARFFVTAVLTQREAGGNLSEVLDNLASIIRDRFKVKRQVRVISAHGRITGWMLSALPTSLALLFFTSTQPGQIPRVLHEPARHADDRVRACRCRSSACSSSAGSSGSNTEVAMSRKSALSRRGVRVGGARRLGGRLDRPQLGHAEQREIRKLSQGRATSC